jgi:predicted XRE-type DNA-binding protein
MMAIKLQRSSGNVFRDLGFAPAEAANLRIRSSLMMQVRQLMKERHLTQVAAAHLFGVSQPRLSDLVRGKIDLFSIDALVKMLARAGVAVTVSIRPQSRVA